jgi:hypothetical protein
MYCNDEERLLGTYPPGCTYVLIHHQLTCDMAVPDRATRSLALQESSKTAPNEAQPVGAGARRCSWLADRHTSVILQRCHLHAAPICLGQREHAENRGSEGFACGLYQDVWLADRLFVSTQLLFQLSRCLAPSTGLRRGCSFPACALLTGEQIEGQSLRRIATGRMLS